MTARSRRSRIDRLGPVTVEAEDAAIRQVARRDIVVILNRVSGERHPVPEVDPEVEAIAAAAKARRPRPSEAEVEAARDRLRERIDRLAEEGGYR